MILSNLPGHQNVISRPRQCVAFDDTRKWYLVSRADGDLLHALGDCWASGARKMPEAWIKRVFKQVMMGLQHCHVHNVVHGDIKPENILMHADVAKLADFGAARQVESSAPVRRVKLLGTPGYIAPELLGGVHVDVNLFAADIWAAGTLLMTMCLLETPREDGSFVKSYDAMPANAAELARRMRDSDPSKRMCVEDVLAHEWLVDM